MLYGGSIPPGRFHGHDVTIQDVFEAIGAHAAGRMTDEELAELESVASPGAGACGGQFTANTMAMAYEMLGHLADRRLADARPGGRPSRRSRAPPGASSIDVLRRGLRPSEMITRAASRTRSPRSPRAAARRTACCTCSRSPAKPASSSRSTTSTRSASARRCSATSSRAGASSPSTSTRPAASRCSRKRLAEAGLLHEDAPTVTGQTIGEIAAAARETPGQEVIRPLADPIKATGGLAILRGNLAPDGCVVKLAGHERRQPHAVRRASSRARRARWRPSRAARSSAGDVVVIRNEGPAGGPGMREMLAVTAAINGAGPG